MLYLKKEVRNDFIDWRKENHSVSSLPDLIRRRPPGNLFQQRYVDTSGKNKDFYQLRYFATVEPYGPFVSDPAGKVTEVVICNKDNYKKYFDWGEIGEHIIGKAYKLWQKRL